VYDGDLDFDVFPRGQAKGHGADEAEVVKATDGAGEGNQRGNGAK
jgi:hypothetical protein